MVKKKDDFHTYVVQLPQVLWEKLCDEAERTERPIAKLIAEMVQKRFGVRDSELPTPKRQGRPPKK